MIPRETGQHAKICILEAETVGYHHPAINFVREVPYAAGNTQVISEPEPSTTITDKLKYKIENAEACTPLHCAINSDCSGTKDKCVAARCASYKTCTQDSNCLYGEGCNPNGKCEEKCPNAIEPFTAVSSNLGHATAVAGTINTFKPTPPALQGIAPSAHIYSANGAIHSNYAYYSMLWCSKKEVDIVNVSYIFASIDISNGKYENDPISKLADWFSIQHNMLFIGGSGNDQTVSTPPSPPKYADNVYANGLTVGGYQHFGTEAWSNDRISPQTQTKNPNTPFSDMMKPDLIAPASDLYRPSLTSSLQPTWQTAAAGTSFAAPFISGLAALLVDWSKLRTFYGVTDYFYKKPQMLKAMIKNASCNRLKNAPNSSSYTNSVIGQGGTSGKLLQMTIDQTPATIILFQSENYRIYQVQLDPESDFLTSSSASTGYKWGQNGRPSMPCFEVEVGKTLRFTLSWDRHVKLDSTASDPESYSYDPHTDLDIFLFSSTDILFGYPTSNATPLTSSVKSDDTTETIQWKNSGSQTQTVCLDIKRYTGGFLHPIEPSIRMAWAGVVLDDECNTNTQ